MSKFEVHKNPLLTKSEDTADSSDHVGAAEAIAKGLIEGHTKERPGYWLHTGGTGILTYFDTVVKKTFGEPDDKVFNDYEGVSEVLNLPADAFHRNVDEIVLKTTQEHPDTVKATIVCPPLIYGKGRGPISGRGRQVYVLADFILLEKYCPRIGRGLGRMNNVHIVDLSQVYELLLEAALDPVKKDDKKIWGAETYFFTENGEHEWATLARQIGEEAQKLGFIAGPPPEFREYSMEEAEKYAGFEAASWGMNSRCKAVRARKVLGWKPWERSLVDEIPTIIVSEAKRLELPLPV
jgi:hypothetical protein